MIEWEKFSTFGDIGELERVCDLFETAKAEEWTSLGDLLGANSYLVKKLGVQDVESARILEIERPGLYQRTWMAGLFRSLYVKLDELTEKPYLLPGELPGLLIDFHKVLIAAHDIYDQSHRAALVEKATAVGIAAGEEMAKKARSMQSKEAVACRTDQKTKAEFIAWGKTAIADGKTAATVKELQAMDGFKPVWSSAVADERTLRKWAKEAGFKFKAGRPKKNK